MSVTWTVWSVYSDDADDDHECQNNIPVLIDDTRAHELKGIFDGLDESMSLNSIAKFILAVSLLVDQSCQI